ncbi:MAG: hypothetical protein K0U45_10065 [Alphaproteobacteria bacterium]|nr:hypothetical protein [Alphaproteobacteria bacterium]
MVVLLFAHHVQAQSLRIAPHDDEEFLRIAFDWPEITAYTISPNIDDNNIVITFAEDNDLTIPTITDQMKIYVDNITRLSDTQIRIQLQDGMAFRPFRFNNSIVFDIMLGDFAEAVENYRYLQESNAPISIDSSQEEIVETELIPSTQPQIIEQEDGDASTASQNDEDLIISEQPLELNVTQLDNADSNEPNDSNRNFETITINTYTLNDGGGRLEFIFSNPPQYQAVANESNISVTFDRPFTVNNLSEIEPSLNLASGPANISENGRVFVLPTSGQLAIAHRRIGRRVVIDILQQERTSQFLQDDTPAEAIISDNNFNGSSSNIIAGYQDVPSVQTTATDEGQSNNIFSSQGVDLDTLDNNEQLEAIGGNTVRIGRTPEYLRIIFDFTTEVQYLIEYDSPNLQITFGQNKPIDISQVEFNYDEPFDNPRILQIDNTSVFAMDVPNSYNIRHFRSGTKIVIDLLPKQQTVAQRDDFPDVEIEGDAQRFASLPFSSPKTQVARRLGAEILALPDAQQTITIPLSEDIGTAFFRHGGYYWFVADRKLPVNISRLRTRLLPLLLDVTPIEVEDATVLRFLPTRDINASIVQKGFNYILRFHDELYIPPQTVSGHIQRDAKNNKFLLLSSRDVGKAVTFTDTAYGGELLVGTFKTLGIANNKQRDFVEFSLLAAQQGIAIVPQIEGINIFDTETGYIINKETGLNIAQQKLEDNIDSQSDTSNEALLNFPPISYSTLPFLEARQQLHNSLDYSLPTNQRGAYHLSAATFYLGQKLNSEAYGYLELYEDVFDNDTSSINYRLLKAAVLLLMERTDEAIEILADDAFSSYGEAVLWQGVAAAQKNEWEAAKLRFDRSSDFTRRYPVYLRNWIANWQIETAFATDDLVVVQSWLDTLRNFTNQMAKYEYQRFLYYDGLYSLRKNDDEYAYRVWEEMIELDPNNKWVVLSELEKINYDIAQGNRTVEESVEALEHLRYIWRGDELELQLLGRLGQLYLDTGEVELGLNILRDASAFFPESPSALLLTQEMLSVFRSIFLEEDENINVDAQTSLKLLRNFRELLPIGNERVRIISTIADNLIKEQFYSNANELLEPLVAERLLTPQQKRTLIVKVGLLHIIGDNPEGTINIFETYRGDLGIESSQESIDARRLYAKALIDLEQPESALDLIAGDLSLNADLLRRDIFWNNKDWYRAALTMQRLTGDPPPEDVFIENRQANYLISWLLALQLSQQDNTLQQVATRFEAGMRNSPLKRVFDYIKVTSTDNFSPDEANQVIRLLSQEAITESFLSDYRARYFNEI